MINNADVTKADVLATNGVVHIIDHVLIPHCLDDFVQFAMAGKTVVDLAVATPDLSTLVTAVKAAGLVDTLSGKGPFTVFAPTNEAFAKLPKATLASLLKPENKQQLVDILTYHVVVGAAVYAKDLTNNEQIKTVEGKAVTAHVSGTTVKINDATVTTANVAASNGVVHIIDTVLLPPSAPAQSECHSFVGAVAAGCASPTMDGCFGAGPNGGCATGGCFYCKAGAAPPAASNCHSYNDAVAAGCASPTMGACFGNGPNGGCDAGGCFYCKAKPAGQNIVQLASATPDLSTLVAAVKAAGLVDTLSSKGPFTVFAPTNEAFAKLPKATLASLLKPENKQQLVDILTYHVVAGDVNKADLMDMDMLQTVEGKKVTVRVADGGVLINSAKVTSADNDASNGVVHIIDAVLMPPSPPAPTPAAPTPSPLPNIPALATANTDLSTLVAALKAADLVDTLSGKGPFTVFAPTNEA